ncbi:MAG: hypothetical protein HYU36_13460 [Planctomycetes bacterium]|nr:hypothetical protein [Planctomycetota bacterium]
MRDDYRNFPGPPKDLELQVERTAEGVVLSTRMNMAPDAVAASQASGMGIRVQELATRVFGCVVIAFAVAGGLPLILMGFLFLFGVLPPNPSGGQAIGRGLAAFMVWGFAAFWIASCGFMFWAVQAARRKFGPLASGSASGGRWRLEMRPGEWVSQAYSAGGGRTARLEPRNMRQLSLDAQGRLVAEMFDENIILTGPLTAAQGDWVLKTLNQFL